MYRKSSRNIALLFKLDIAEESAMMTLQTARLITNRVNSGSLRRFSALAGKATGLMERPRVLPGITVSVLFCRDRYKSAVYVVPRDTQWTTKRFSPAMTSIGSVAHEASRGRSSWAIFKSTLRLQTARVEAGCSSRLDSFISRWRKKNDVKRYLLNKSKNS